MRVILFFDLPVLTANDRKNYREFRKFLVKNGFLMAQESVYVKLTLNSTAADAVIECVRRHKPPSGVVQALRVTEKQYQSMEFIVGGKNSSVLDSDERLVIL